MLKRNPNRTIIKSSFGEKKFHTQMYLLFISVMQVCTSIRSCDLKRN